MMKTAKTPTRKAFSEAMLAHGHADPDFVVLEADIGYSTYSYLFGDAYPQRYFNMGIAELGMFASAAGIASTGRSVVCGSYGVFITMRALEAIRSFICYPNLNVKLLSSHGGLTAAIDGVSHQATEDIAFMTTLPNMKVVVPCDGISAAAAFHIAMETPGPVFTRLMRDPLFDLYPVDEQFSLGGSKKVVEGTDITIVSYGDMLFRAIEAATELAKDGISAEVLDAYSVKPFDRTAILASAKKTGAVLVVENHQRRNGLAYEIAHFLLRTYPVPFESIGLDDTFAESGSYELILDKYGLSSGAIIETSKRLVRERRN